MDVPIENIPKTTFITLLENVAHKKFFIALFFVWQVLSMTIPESIMSWKIYAFQVSSAFVVSLTAIGCQTHLDKNKLGPIDDVRKALPVFNQAEIDALRGSTSAELVLNTQQREKKGVS